MQTADALERVAREAVIDLASTASCTPSSGGHRSSTSRGGLSLQETVEAVGRGLAQGEQMVRDAGGAIVARQP